MVAGQVKVGDHVRDFGVVTDITVFGNQVAANKRSVLPDNAPYWQHVSEQMNSCYEIVPNKVVLQTAFSSRCFYCDDAVELVILPNALKQAA